MLQLEEKTRTYVAWKEKRRFIGGLTLLGQGVWSLNVIKVLWILAFFVRDACLIFFFSKYKLIFFKYK